MTCLKCGKILEDGSKFCNKCGCCIDGENKIYPKISYDGEIKKCPNCGEILKGFLPVCPACGIELRNVKSSIAVKEFSAKMEKIEANGTSETIPSTADRSGYYTVTKKDEEAISLIKNYGIPNTKEDLMEFIIMASSNIDYDALACHDSLDFGGVYTNAELKKRMDNSQAWIIKLEQAYQKAYVSFKNDEDFDKIVEIYNKTHNKLKESEILKKQRGVKRKRKQIRSVIMFVFLLFVFCGIAALPYIDFDNVIYKGKNNNIILRDEPSEIIEGGKIYPSEDKLSIIYNSVIYPPNAVYTSYAYENGLEGTPCVVKGTIIETYNSLKDFCIARNKEYDNSRSYIMKCKIMIVKTDRGDVQIYDIADSDIEQSISENGYSETESYVHAFRGYSEYPSLGEEVNILCIYSGYSDKFSIPSFAYGINEGYCRMKYGDF